MGSHVLHIGLVQENFPHKSTPTATNVTTATITINVEVGNGHPADDSPLHRQFPEAIFVGFPIAGALTVLTLLYKDSDKAGGGQTMLLNIFSSSILMLFCLASAAMTFRCKYPKIAATCGGITIFVTFLTFGLLGCMILPKGYWWMAWLFSSFPLLPFILHPCELLFRRLGRKVSQGLPNESNITKTDFDLQDFDSGSSLWSPSRWPLHQTGSPQMDSDLQVLKDDSRLLCSNALLWRQFSMPQMDFDLQVVNGGNDLLQKISSPLWSRFNIPQLDFDLQVFERHRRSLNRLRRSISQTTWHQSNINPLHMDFKVFGL